MADNVVGGNLSASGQNESNVNYLGQLKSFNRSNDGSNAHSWYTWGVQTVEYPSYWNIGLGGLYVGDTEVRIRDYDTDAILIDWDGTGDPGVNLPALTVSASNRQYFLPPGRYKVDVNVDSVPNFPSGTLSGLVLVSYRQAQTDIAEDDPIGIWKSDYSEFEAPQFFEDGIPISYSENNLIGRYEELD